MVLAMTLAFGAAVSAADQSANPQHELARQILGHPSVASKEPIVRQYDHTVQGTNGLPPFG